MVSWRQFLLTKETPLSLHLGFHLSWPSMACAATWIATNKVSPAVIAESIKQSQACRDLCRLPYLRAVQKGASKSPSGHKTFRYDQLWVTWTSSFLFTLHLFRCFLFCFSVWNFCQTRRLAKLLFNLMPCETLVKSDTSQNICAIPCLAGTVMIRVGYLNYWAEYCNLNDG